MRELANVIERAVALAEHDTVVPEDLSLQRPGQHEDLLRQAAAQHCSLAELERSYVRQMVEVAGGNKARAARILDIDRRTLYRKLGEPQQPEADLGGGEGDAAPGGGPAAPQR